MLPGYIGNPRPWEEDEARVFHNRASTVQGHSMSTHCMVCQLEVDGSETRHVVKVIEKEWTDHYEAEILADLFHLTSSCLRNPVIPFEVFDCAKSKLIIMPQLCPLVNLSPWASGIHQIVLDFITQAIEAVDFLHSHNYAHLDIDMGNFVFALENTVFGSFNIPKMTVYLIDFGHARRFDSGPGTNVTISHYPGGHLPPPEGEESVEPFAYDVYSLGIMIEDLCNLTQYLEPELQSFVEFLTVKDPQKRPMIGQVKEDWASLRRSLRRGKLLNTCAPI
ncbi:kinase-like domain-containing protein [Cristinia sonorae]|uniref:Kinase-like domain-containing protein n=1 Tax=Cristinia sonorae TaxID=1940300 RepID=A0A8K0XMN4_9AGAR|nr:kinase-like domain-containing protein [Cristinia sonorae]